MQVLSEQWPNFPWMNLACCQTVCGVTRKRRIVNMLLLGWSTNEMPFCWTIPALEFSVDSAPGRALSTVSGDTNLKVGIPLCHILRLAALSGWWDLLEVSSVFCSLLCWFFLSARHLMLYFQKQTCLSRIELNIPTFLPESRSLRRSKE